MISKSSIQANKIKKKRINGIDGILIDHVFLFCWHEEVKRVENLKMPYWNLTWILTYGIVPKREGISHPMLQISVFVFWNSSYFWKNNALFIASSSKRLDKSILSETISLFLNTVYYIWYDRLMSFYQWITEMYSIIRLDSIMIFNTKKCCD